MPLLPDSGTLTDPAAARRARLALPIGIVGAGRLGSALAAALRAAGYADVRLASRDEAHARGAAARAGVAVAAPFAIVEDCALVVLAVPDRSIAEVAAALPWRAGQGAVHASGALGLDALNAAAGRGALTGCLHPLQTFPAAAPEPARLFSGIVCGIEAAGLLGRLLEALVNDLGARSVRLEGIDRAAYHAAAVLVSNDLVALMAAATRAWALAGLPAAEAQAALGPLLSSAAANTARIPLAEALTGPVARGDASTVERHLRALAGEPDLAALYAALGRELLRLDLGHAPGTARALAALLAPPTGTGAPRGGDDG